MTKSEQREVRRKKAVYGSQPKREIYHPHVKIKKKRTYPKEGRYE
jgi:hypothetical protein